MQHSTLLSYLVSFLTGIFSIGISTGIYLQYRREAILHFRQADYRYRKNGGMLFLYKESRGGPITEETVGILIKR
jgi:hypothetical protein